MYKICNILMNLSSSYICWPIGSNLENVTEMFYKKQGFPGVVGAIDDTHIPITPPIKEQSSYCNRHHYHSIILPGVCTADFFFTDVFTGIQMQNYIF